MYSREVNACLTLEITQLESVGSGNGVELCRRCWVSEVLQVIVPPGWYKTEEEVGYEQWQSDLESKRNKNLCVFAIHPCVAATRPRQFRLDASIEKIR